MNNTQLKENFIKDLQTVGAHHSKKIINELPSWDYILNVLNGAIQDQYSSIKIHANTDYEIIYKDLIAMKRIKHEEKTYNHSIESDATFFFSLFFDEYTYSNVISQSLQKQIDEIKETLDIEAKLNSLKIALADKFVPPESHDGNTMIVQLQGTNTWTVIDNKNNKDLLYVLEPGDCLFFNEKMKHSLTNDKPRSSLVGMFVLGDSHER